MSKLFVPFISAGYPTIDTTKNILLEFNDMGLPYIELGIPYSDPIADGPVIQKASEIALQNGINLSCIFDMVNDIKEIMTSKLIVFSYYNPLYVFGFEKFCQKCKETGIYGVLIPDIPTEEESEVIDLLEEFGLVLIPLVTPTSKDRLSYILHNKKRGFVYCVSSLGVTGERAKFHVNLKQFIAQVRAHTQLPIVIGFGVSNREQAREMAEMSDGVVIGSKIISIIKEASEKIFQEDYDRFSNDAAKTVAKEVRKHVEKLCPYVYNK
ncbi:tryptophan synthase subunit alpha [Desulfuribacillus stibiiarsenatis]|uniref:Tryptophan synthase alpha chain n=1 Tax=Desulfuribacillus stibiiarsenatis TaxID=1390249 RepID=A0A1E5L704_9FIRM|nr:tryptophan synthase subunit alpha [Desulfuribacillus stibiiarsenatis]OEH85925.1 tryptophan synthase subunit alpha [Desulfuribacillus stibiiarsenatis]